MCCKIPTLLITDDFPSSLDTRFDWSKYIQKTKTTFNYRLSLLKNFFGKSSKLILKTKMSYLQFPPKTYLDQWHPALGHCQKIKLKYCNLKYSVTSLTPLRINQIPFIITILIFRLSSKSQATL